ncbi:iron ABC transporter permease [Saccharibacillus sp. O23]|uniref:FecCD family ABC transporter permease n=1 Tax=Saccharibacillus sp. O23 TaxID=2009338 RepID=UPI000B4E6C23|nr:iron ABC transporter permease [Saccharibacillus sp. O23]OWR31517.1 iron ABC transporter permease [Saccharibacillus sp. O23]
MRFDSPRRTASVAAIALVLILVIAYISVTNGMFDLSVGDVVRTLLRIDPIPEHDLVVFDFRLPRIVIALLVGFGLGIAGSVVQGITRNGLADPGMLGINAGAGMAIVLFMLILRDKLDFKDGWLSFMAMPMFGLFGGLAAAALIFLFAQNRGRLDPQQLILVGIAVGSGFGAVTLYLSLKMSPSDFEAAAVWLAGSLHRSNWRYIAAMLPWFVLLTPYIVYKSRMLDVMQLRDESSQGLGVELTGERRRLVLAAVGLVAACVSVSGSIGFVGLIAPHIARRLVGVRHRHMLPISGLIGAATVAAGDLIGRTVFAPAELAVGVVVSIIGVPYFVYLLFKSRV